MSPPDVPVPPDMIASPPLARMLPPAANSIVDPGLERLEPPKTEIEPAAEESLLPVFRITLPDFVSAESPVDR